VNFPDWPRGLGEVVGAPAQRGAQGLRARLLELRNRVYASARFQYWAMGFPLARPIARRRARALFDLCAGFVYSQILSACIELGLLERLAGGPSTLTELASRLSLPADAALRLLRAAESLRLVQRCAPDTYVLGYLGAALIGNAGVAKMVRHHSLLYRDLADPVSLLRGARGGTALADYWAYVASGHPQDLDPERTAGYTELMAESQSLVARDILDAYPMAQHRRILDLAGGNGTFLCSVGERWPHLELRLLDLPPVAERARERFVRAGFGDRAVAIGGDLFSGALPEGADLCSLVRVVHDHDDEPASAILAAARRALPSGGTLLLAEPMAGTPGALPMGDAYFGFYLFAMGSGRPRTAGELMSMLRIAGFRKIREIRTRRPLFTRLIVASA
jgi:demethylspheroidene O-methyltransferase